MITRQDIEQLLQTKNVEEFKDLWAFEYLPFEKAREYVRKLKFRTRRDWEKYCKSGERPAEIPSHPDRNYKEWAGMANWLGVGSRFKPFEEAQLFVKKLKFKNTSEWKKYCKNGKPSYIPADPRLHYKKYWKGMRDWLGNQFWTFNEARKFIRNLKLKGEKDWIEYYKSGKKPTNIPSGPRQFYKKEWINLADWLGNGKVSIEYRPFCQARSFANKLQIKNHKDWIKYCKNKPIDIPSNPNVVYKEEWKGWSDWLHGYQRLVFKSLEKAKIYVRKLGLKNNREWRKYCKSGKNPRDIPRSPDQVYKNWIGWADWLGTGYIKKGFKSFKKARAYIRKLKLKNTDDWEKYCKSGKKPIDIPATPYVIYKKYWINIADWLGKIPYHTNKDEL